MNREGQAYKNKKSGAIVVVVASKSMSAGTTRHTVLILDEAGEPKVGNVRKAGDQVDIDEVPTQPWDKGWEAV